MGSHGAEPAAAVPVARAPPRPGILTLLEMSFYYTTVQ